MSAVFSPCGLFRYRLEREVQATGPVYAYLGVNPSFAGAEINDQTVKKWIGFTRIFGGRRFIVGNPFAFKATDVRKLATAADPVGPDNDRHLRAIAAEADILVPCWGSRDKIPRPLHRRLDDTLAMLLATGKPVMAFGFTASGDPTHPQMLGYKTELQYLDLT
jgi:hypothetical protein